MPPFLCRLNRHVIAIVEPCQSGLKLPIADGAFVRAIAFGLNFRPRTLHRLFNPMLEEMRHGVIGKHLNRNFKLEIYPAMEPDTLLTEIRDTAEELLSGRGKLSKPRIAVMLALITQDATELQALIGARSKPSIKPE